MARLIDGEGGQFGFSASLVKVGEPEPSYKEEPHFENPTGWYEVDAQFGFYKKPVESEICFYRVHVERD